MVKFYLDNKIARLIILQRIELATPLLKKIRKLFGRSIFSNYITKFFLNANSINKNYYTLMQSELRLLENYLDFNNKELLSIGGGVGGLELLISKKYNCFFNFIEKNYISKKVVYGWDDNNNEGYNDLNLLKSFLLRNDMNKEKFKIFDYDQDILPDKKFDIIISLYSLDYHYDFNIYYKYLKKVSHKKTILVLDTIRAESFKNFFNKVEIIKNDDQTVHKSKRVMCTDII